MVMTKMLIALLGSYTMAFAQAVYTPPLQTTNNTVVCRVVNLNGANIAPCISAIRSNGTTLASGCPSVAPGGVGEIDYAASASTVAYCKATFASNTEADNSRVNLLLQDATGTSYSSVRGLRNGNNTGAHVTTPSVQAGYPSIVACRVLNTDSVDRSVTIDMYDDAGTAQEGGTATIAAGTSTSVWSSSATYPNGTVARHCDVTAGSGTIASKLRVAIAVKTDIAGTPPNDSYAPVEGY